MIPVESHASSTDQILMGTALKAFLAIIMSQSSWAQSPVPVPPCELQCYQINPEVTANDIKSRILYMGLQTKPSSQASSIPKPSAFEKYNQEILQPALKAYRPMPIQNTVPDPRSTYSPIEDQRNNLRSTEKVVDEISEASPFKIVTLLPKLVSNGTKVITSPIKSGAQVEAQANQLKDKVVASSGARLVPVPQAPAAPTTPVPLPPAVLELAHDMVTVSATFRDSAQKKEFVASPVVAQNLALQGESARLLSLVNQFLDPNCKDHLQFTRLKDGDPIANQVLSNPVVASDGLPLVPKELVFGPNQIGDKKIDRYFMETPGSETYLFRGQKYEEDIWYMITRDKATSQTRHSVLKLVDQSQEKKPVLLKPDQNSVMLGGNSAFVGAGDPSYGPKETPMRVEFGALVSGVRLGSQARSVGGILVPTSIDVLSFNANPTLNTKNRSTQFHLQSNVGSNATAVGVELQSTRKESSGATSGFQPIEPDRTFQAVFVVHNLETEWTFNTGTTVKISKMGTVGAACTLKGNFDQGLDLNRSSASVSYTTPQMGPRGPRATMSVEARDLNDMRVGGALISPNGFGTQHMSSPFIFGIEASPITGAGSVWFIAYIDSQPRSRSPVFSR